MTAAGLAIELRGRLGRALCAADRPLVSIVVANHNGAAFLRTLLTGLLDRTDYPSFELILVDNGSSDESLELTRRFEAPFPISIVANHHNESFSDANNQGAAIARGELLLFLNNDVEPIEPGWLDELVACLEGSGAGAVGATLVFPHEDRARFPHGFAVQHRGLRFRDEHGVIGPALHDWEADPLDLALGQDAETPVVVAACLLLEAQLFARVGGFTHGYLYGSEDIDLCLKLRDAGAAVVCSGRSVLIHRPGSTRRSIEFEQARERKLRNHRLLMERWGPRLRREHDLDALAGGGMWVQRGREDGALAASFAEAEALGICLRLATPAVGAIGPAALAAQRQRALDSGHRCLALQGEEVDDLRGLELDIAIHCNGPKRYLPAPGQFNVLWAARPGEDPAAIECDRHDLVLSADEHQATRLRVTSGTPVEVAAEDSLIDAALAAVASRGRLTRIGLAPTGKLRLVQYWHEETPPDYIAELLDTFREHNPGMAHTVFDEASARELIATRFGARELAAFDACAIPAMQADYLRYAALLADGGVYSDADLRCVGSLESLVAETSGAAILRYHKGGSPLGIPMTLLANDFLIFKEPGHPLLELALSMATTGIEQTLGREPASTVAPTLITGPFIFTGLYLAFSLGSLDALRKTLSMPKAAWLVRRLCEAIGEYDRVARAFEGVRLLTREECTVIEPPGVDLPYRRSESHWPLRGSGLYRSRS